jgi:hypothetical protein
MRLLTAKLYTPWACGVGIYAPSFSLNQGSLMTFFFLSKQQYIK